MQIAIPRSLSRPGRALANDAHVDLLARVGYASRGVVYGLIGLFAVLLSFGMGGRLTDTKGLFRGMLSHPLGKVFLLALGLGLFCYAVWRILQAVRDYEGRGNDAKGLAMRASYLLRGLFYAVVGYSAWNLVLHLSDSGGGMSESKIARVLMSQSYGHLLTGMLGLIIIGVGLGQFYVALKEKFMEGIRLPRGKEWLLCALCKAGIIARGCVFGIVGGLFVSAALHNDSREAAGLRGVWRVLRAQAYGEALVLALALGFVAFAVYAFIEAIYRDSHVS